MKPRVFFKWSLAVLLILFFIWAEFFYDLSSFMDEKSIQSWLLKIGPLAPLYYILLMMIAIVFSPLPSLPLAVAAGAFFGPFLATLYSVTGGFIGAVISFTLARYLGRDFLGKYFKIKIDPDDYGSKKVLFRMILIARLLPFVSFDIISYGAGLTSISLLSFSSATLLGMLPMTFAYSYFGSILTINWQITVIFGLIMITALFLIPSFFKKGDS